MFVLCTYNVEFPRNLLPRGGNGPLKLLVSDNEKIHPTFYPRLGKPRKKLFSLVAH